MKVWFHVCDLIANEFLALLGKGNLVVTSLRQNLDFTAEIAEGAEKNFSHNLADLCDLRGGNAATFPDCLFPR